jgi:hypothetical protein
VYKPANVYLVSAGLNEISSHTHAATSRSSHGGSCSILEYIHIIAKHSEHTLEHSRKKIVCLLFLRVSFACFLRVSVACCLRVSVPAVYVYLSPAVYVYLSLLFTCIFRLLFTCIFRLLFTCILTIFRLLFTCIFRLLFTCICRLLFTCIFRLLFTCIFRLLFTCICRLLSLSLLHLKSATCIHCHNFFMSAICYLMPAIFCLPIFYTQLPAACSGLQACLHRAFCSLLLALASSL